VRRLLARLHDPAVAYNRDAIVAVSPAYERLVGHSAADLVGGMIATPDVEGRRRFRRQLAAHGTTGGSTKLIDASGEAVAIQFRACAVGPTTDGVEYLAIVHPIAQTRGEVEANSAQIPPSTLHAVPPVAQRTTSGQPAGRELSDVAMAATRDTDHRRLIGSNLRLIREALMVSQTWVAAAVMTDRGTISGYESGRHAPSFGRLVDLAGALEAELQRHDPQQQALIRHSLRLVGVLDASWFYAEHATEPE